MDIILENKAFDGFYDSKKKDVQLNFGKFLDLLIKRSHFCCWWLFANAHSKYIYIQSKKGDAFCTSSKRWNLNHCQKPSNSVLKIPFLKNEWDFAAIQVNRKCLQLIGKKGREWRLRKSFQSYEIFVTLAAATLQKIRKENENEPINTLSDPLTAKSIVTRW